MWVKAEIRIRSFIYIYILKALYWGNTIDIPRPLFKENEMIVGIQVYSQQNLEALCIYIYILKALYCGNTIDISRLLFKENETIVGIQVYSQQNFYCSFVYKFKDTINEYWLETSKQTERA